MSPKIIENGTNQKRGTVSHLHSVATITVSLVISEYIRRQITAVPLPVNSRFGVIQGH